MGNTQFNHAVLARVAKSLMRSCGVRTRITCVFHRVNFKWAQCASPQPAPSHLEFALTLEATPLEFLRSRSELCEKSSAFRHYHRVVERLRHGNGRLYLTRAVCQIRFVNK